jgi:alpha,alpha-trehalase
MKQKQIFELSPLFEDVQMQQVFADGKTFVDCIPKADADTILAAYHKAKDKAEFDLKQFVLAHFALPKTFTATIETASTVEEHIHQLWSVLTRKPDEAGGSLIPLPSAYVVPGGRFGEVYYWDSYFTMLGLHASGMYEMIENMVKNFAHLIHTIGFIPNGNRTYYLGRSQPPFFSLMVQLLATVKGKTILVDYLPQLEKEYSFWMTGKEQLHKRNIAVNYTVLMSNGAVLNRYWDAFDTPRPESYREDVELSHDNEQPKEILYRHLRAGAASGWDYSCRWFAAINRFDTIHTTEIIPVDLNCLLYHLELTIAEALELKNEIASAQEMKEGAEKRKTAIQYYCWNDALQFYTDYDFINGETTVVKSLAASFALYFKIATKEQADAIAVTLEKEFLKDGGLVTTLHQTGQQWDAPNGWAPLQWMSILGLEKYNYSSLAAETARRWIQLNKNVFARTGKLMEKYNVVDTHLEAGGGEYEGQDGFGWTNGVLLALIKKYQP